MSSQSPADGEAKVYESDKAIMDDSSTSNATSLFDKSVFIAVFETSVGVTVFSFRTE